MIVEPVILFLVCSLKEGAPLRYTLFVFYNLLLNKVLRLFFFGVGLPQTLCRGMFRRTL